MITIAYRTVARIAHTKTVALQGKISIMLACLLTTYNGFKRTILKITFAVIGVASYVLVTIWKVQKQMMLYITSKIFAFSIIIVIPQTIQSSCGSFSYSDSIHCRRLDVT